MNRILPLSLCLIIATLLMPAAAAQTCIGTPGTTNPASAIQAKLNSGVNAVLCPNTVWSITTPIVFPLDVDSISIYTEGFPHDDSRALLRIDSASVGSAVVASVWHWDGSRIYASDDVQLRNLRIDGGLDRFGSCADHNCYSSALIHFGGPASGQIVDSVKAWNARGWSTLLFERGSSAYHNGCSYAQATNNTLGPSGLVQAGRLTDGISLQCSMSDVYYNLIQDTSDVGIAIFGAPGSTVHHNDIRANTSQMNGGISMTDQWGTYDGNFSGTSVYSNTLTANVLMRFGINMGPKLHESVCREDIYNWGASVTGNALYGTAMGFGYVADGVHDWTVTGNTDDSTHAGTTSSDCLAGCSQISAVGGFVRHIAHTNYNTTFQSQFVDGCTHYVNVQ
jgi:hypothetical protein